MPSFQTRRVTELLSERAGLQRVRLDDGTRAYNLRDQLGDVAVGDEVVVNTTAVELGLGTGGWHVVHWNLSAQTFSRSGDGHIMKLRYTSLQTDTGAAEEHHPELPQHLGGAPVVVCSLHSQMGVVAAAFHDAAPDRRLAYVMTDGAALPLAMSDLVASLREKGLLCGSVTVGHAFGGDHEAVSVAGGLLAARHLLDADVIVISMGPGVVGTGSTYGTTALEVVDAAAWAYRLGGRTILAARVSDGDARERHRGLSHHSATALAALGDPPVPLTVARPEGSDLDVPRAKVHSVEPVPVPDVAALLDRIDVRITTMGRDVRADPAFFAWSAAAGVCAARRLAE